MPYEAMPKQHESSDSLVGYERRLVALYRADGTRKIYLAVVRRFLKFAAGRNLDQDLLWEYQDATAPKIDRNTWKTEICLYQ